MAKKIKVETKKPDLLYSSLQYCLDWIRNNAQTSILIGVVILCLVGAGFGLAAYQSSKNEKAQYGLSQAIRNYEEGVNGKGDGLAKAEEDFKGLTKSAPAGIKDVAKLYLARIALTKGKTDEAKALYSEVSRKPSNDVVKRLSDNALKDLQKK
jgi:hypothetical protein